MDSNAPPPAYSLSVSPSGPVDPPPEFEPGSSAPVIIDSKPPLDDHNESTSTLPRRSRASNGTASEVPLPYAFGVGSKTLNPFELVTIPEIRAHLSFLGAFVRLKAQVKSQKGPNDRADELWAIYIARSVDRFATWVRKGLSDNSASRELTGNEIPPLDILMVWHTYMLNPRVYYEDGLTKNSQLLSIKSFPLGLVRQIINIDTLAPVEPSFERRERFELLTGQSWDIPPSTTLSDTTLVPCPRCEDKTPTEVYWITKKDTGFSQHNFKAQCHTCMGIFDRNAMMARGLCDDIIRVRLSSDDQPVFMAGTLLDWKTGKPDSKTATLNNEILLKNFLTSSMKKFIRGDQLAGSLEYSIQQVEGLLKSALAPRNGGQQVTRILSHYRSPSYPFSIELCGAILRQGSFIDKIVNLGWTEPRTFDEEPSALMRCIARYNAWLDVMTQLSKQALVPTLDIDLAWHTHQLKQESYRLQTLDIIGSFVDHDDKIEENKLSEAYDQTAKYWEQRWGVPYHVCGCIHPPAQESIDTATKLASIFRGKNKAPAEFANPRPVLVSTHDLDAQPTHPSEHNAVLVIGQPLSESRRSKRVQEHAKWEKQTRADVAKGRVPPDGWESMTVQRGKHHEQGFMRPFLDPNLMPVIPFGAETCASHDGGVLDGHTLTAAPTDGKHSAGICAAGMGHYGMMPIGGLRIGSTGSCAGAGGCAGSGIGVDALGPKLEAALIGGAVWL